MLNKEIIEKYKEMKAKKNRIGDYKKTLFHVHPPASYDYRFKSGWNSNDFNPPSFIFLPPIIYNIIIPVK